MKINIFEFTIYIVIIVFVYLLALLSSYRSSFFDFNRFSYCTGLGLAIVFYGNSQKIINKNQFKQFAVLGLLMLIFSTTLSIVTKGSFLGLIFTAYPLLYIIYFRLLIFLFYKDFANTYKKPTILFASRIKWTSDNGDYGYKPSKKEMIFSKLLFFGSFIFASTLAFIII